MARQPEPAPRPSRITIPDRCHPIAKIVFAEMQRQSITYDELEHRSGVLRSTFKAWRTDNRPGLDSAEAALGALGWALVPVPALEHVQADVRDGLKVLAEQWKGVNPTLHQLMATVARAPVVQVQPEGAAVAANTTLNRKARRAQKAMGLPDQAALFEEEAA